MRVINGIIGEMKSFLICFLSFIPGRLGRLMRYVCFSPFFKACGKKVSFSTQGSIIGFKNISLGSDITTGMNVRLYAAGNNDEIIEIGNNVSINDNVMLNADFSGQILIGNHVLIGPNVVFRASNHNYKQRDTFIKSQGHKKGRIIVEDDVWIAANAVILPDVIIREGAVVSAGSVVTKEVAPFTVVGGVPAKKISERR